MPLRPGRCYRHFSGPAYTRREFVRGVPASKLTKFDMGNIGGDFAVTVNIVADQAGQIRSNSLEAARIIANKYLTVKVGDTNYHLKVRVFPHHVLKENKMIAGAGADRLQDGMRQSFGKPIGSAARVYAGQPVITVRIAPQFVAHVKEAYRLMSHKIPVRCRVQVEKGQELVKSIF